MTALLVPIRIVRFIFHRYGCLLVMASLLGAGVASTSLPAQTTVGERSVTGPVMLSPRPAGAGEVKFFQSPLSFEPNVGQDKSVARYIGYGRGYLLRLEPSRALIEFSAPLDKRSAAPGSKNSTLALSFVGGNDTAGISATEKLQGKHSYFPASDRKSWMPNVPTFGRVSYESLYPGIDLSFYGNASRIEYDFVLRPGSDAKTIRVALDGAERARLDRNGNLLLRSQGSALTLLKPVAYQQFADGSRQAVEVEYHLRQADKRANSAMLSFDLGGYDRSKALIIDPVLVYGVDIPGASGFARPPYYFADTAISAMTADAQGNTYVAARVASSSSNYSVLKFDPQGNLLFNVSLGSTDVQASPFSIAVDTGGDIYLAGSASQGLPTTVGAFQPSMSLPNYGQSGFLTVIRSDASKLMYSTYLGGHNSGQINGVAVDSSGDAYVTGSTYAGDFPTTAGVYQPSVATNYSDNGFVAKLDPKRSGTSSLIYSTFLAADGNSQDSSTGNGIAVDSSGNAYVIEGATADYPITKGAYRFEGIDNAGAYITKLNANGTALVYSAFLGPGTPAALALDGSGEAYIVGSVRSAEFPTTAGAYQTKDASGFVAKLSSDGSSLLFSTFLSGAGGVPSYNTTPTGVAIVPGCLAACDVYVAGDTLASDFPLINPIQSFPGGFAPPAQPNSIFESGFLVNLAPDGKSAIYSTYLGAATSLTFAGSGLAADSSGNIYFAANAQGPDAPITLPAVQNPGEGFLLKISPANAGAVIVLPGQIVFGASQAVNSTTNSPTAVQLRNMGSQAVTLQRPFTFSSKEFSETDNCAASLPAGGICKINLSFTPAASGQRTATLTIGSSAPNSPAVASLAGTGADGPNLIVSATSLTFADQVVKSASSPQTVTLTNSGDQPQPITSIRSSLPDYVTGSTCPPQIAAGATCQITVKFSPTQIGLRSDFLLIQEPGTYIYVTLMGTGVLNAAGTGTVALSDTAINFGGLVVGAIAETQSIALINTGDAPVSVNSITVATNANQGGQGDFSFVPPNQNTYNACGYSAWTGISALPFQLPPQSSCTVMVAFQPSTSGQEAGTLKIADSAAGSPQTVGLSGIGIHSVQPLTVNPGTMAFPAQPVGDPSAPQTFYVYNGGEDFVMIDRAVTTGDFALVGPSSFSCEGITLGPLASCTLSIAFYPTAVGPRTGTLTLTDALTGNPQVFNLMGTAIQATGALMLGQPSLTFAAQARGTTSASQEIVVSNPGNSPVTINNLAIAGDFAVTSQFAPYNTACGGVLAPNSTCDIWIGFSPTLASGPETGTLTIHSTVGNLLLSLSGSSFTTAQSVHLTPSTIDFGIAQVKNPSGNSVNVYIENTGAEPITFSNPPTIAGISPAPSADFGFSTGSCYAFVPSYSNATLPPLPPGQSCSFAIAFTPTTQTTEKATFTLVDSAGTQAIALSGVGAAAIPAEVLRPSTLSFDQQPLGSSTPPYNYNFQLYFYNNGTQPVIVSSVTVTAGSADFSASSALGSCAGQTVYPGAYCPAGFVFHPSVLGYRTGTVTYKDGAGKTFTAGLAGYAIAEVNRASLTPEALILPSTSLQGSGGGYTPYPPSVVLNNTGNAPLTVGTISGTNVSATGDFSMTYPAGNDACSGTTIPPGGTCSVNIAFTPRATGTRSGSLTFPVTYANKATASLTATLSGNGLPNVGTATLLPQTLTFPSQVAGGNGQNYQNGMSVLFTNTGTIQLTVGAISGTNLTPTPGSGGDFSIAYNNCGNQVIYPGASCTTVLSFLPVTAGSKTGSVTMPVTYAGGATATFTSTLSGNSVAPAPALQVNPPGLAFNVEVVGTADGSNTQTVVLTDTGNVNVKISSIATSPNFTITSNGCNQFVQLQLPCYVTVGFTPLASTAPGPVSGTLTIVDNAPGSPHTVKLSGSAISVAQQLALSQTSVSFGNQVVGTASAPQVVYLTDLGSSSTSGPASRIQINSIKLGGTNAADFTESENCGGTLGFTIGGRMSCMITVGFAPGQSSLGTRTASVAITPAQGSPLVIQLVGIGVAPPPAAAIYPAKLTFAPQPVGNTSSAQAFSVTNTGAAALSIAQVLTSHPSEFSLHSDGCSNKSLARGANCIVSVSFHPESAGPLTAMLELRDKAGRSVQTAALNGEGARSAQTILFRSKQKPATGLPSIELLATATSALPVGYEVVSGRGRLEGNVLKSERPGYIVIRATQPGNERFAPAKRVEHTFLIRESTPSIVNGKADSK